MLQLDKNILQPVIITFNRAKHLEATLHAFYGAGFGTIDFHVLDNASTDNTKEVVENFQVKWPKLHYHCNKYNIGGNANTLRAVEIANSEYHWVIGDDDAWHLSELTELLEVLQARKADVIRLGWLVSNKTRGEYLDSETVRQEEKMFFGSMSMISATIIRRNFFVKHLKAAYQNISHFYPQLVPMILENHEGKFSVYSVKNDIMLHTPNHQVAYFLGDFEWYSIWYKTSTYFIEPIKKAKFNRETLCYLKFMQAHRNKASVPFIIAFTRVALYFKSLGISQFRYFMEIFIYGVGARGKFVLPFIFYCIIPTTIAKGLRRIYEIAFRTTQKDPVRDLSR